MLGQGTPAAGATADDGEARVTATLARLAVLGDTPVHEHVAVFEEVLGGLEATLASVEDVPAATGQDRR
ncbi:hypothetical protein GCM10009677_52320 [Sphaerisporangium rubeum]|uniref:Uncharacterized protein n=2 Tax=Sphaerisporangium rubeum TaxID=321317 RepID=A0A7X0IEG8_9ACTN|nr:hypothetical protein [Sphaerisporangium rubeum]